LVFARDFLGSMCSMRTMRTMRTSSSLLVCESWCCTFYKLHLREKCARI